MTYVALSPIPVVGAAIHRDGRILATQRATGPLAGLWEFPGGKIEPGESPEQALARELMEELECDVEVGELITSTQHAYDFATIDLAVYRCTLKADAPRLTEHSDARWLLPSELLSVAWAPADEPAVAELQRQSAAQ